jgi:hypothetical protein
LPSTICYFVPGSGQGSELPLPKSAISPAFIKTADGIGLNLGCPIRLLRALDALEVLTASEREAPLPALRDPRNHLSAVEELLWLTGWRAESIRRGGQLAGMAGDVDWQLTADGLTIYLEAKFRRSDWARLVDYDTFLKAGDGFLSKATHKFPARTANGTLHVVGITTFDDISEDFVHALVAELRAAPQIHAVVVRSFLQMTHIIALRADVAERLRDLLTTPDAASLPLHYPVIFHIEQRGERRRARPPLPASPEHPVTHLWIGPVNGQLIKLPEPSLYRMSIPDRGADGEPHFKMIPKYLFV